MTETDSQSGKSFTGTEVAVELKVSSIDTRVQRKTDRWELSPK